MGSSILWNPLMPKVLNKSIKYSFYLNNKKENSKSFSLKIKDSDFAPNETILNSLIGTLVKYDNSGKLSPYLAKSIEVSTDGLVWSFRFKDNLYCSNGKAINAKTFSNALMSQLRIYTKYSSALDFELLDGWSEFKDDEKSSISGIVVKQDMLSFIFKKRPEDFLELLRMPYFGFWCSELESKFPESSSAYEVDLLKTNDKSITLKKRDNWPLSLELSADSIEYSFIDLDEINYLRPDILEYTRFHNLKIPNGYLIVNSPPTMLLTLVISPYVEGVFSKIENRRIFYDYLQTEIMNSNRLNSKSFYGSAISSVNHRLNTQSFDANGAELKFAYPSKNFHPDIKREIEEHINNAAKKYNFNAKFFESQPFENNWRSRLLSNKEFDARINLVDIGGHIQNFALKMIFCSNLGVNYPDPSGNICKLTVVQDISRAPISDEYIRNFNQFLYDDACVLPLTHTGKSWLINSKINPKDFPSTVVTPLMERVEIFE